MILKEELFESQNFHSCMACMVLVLVGLLDLRNRICMVLVVVLVGILDLRNRVCMVLVLVGLLDLRNTVCMCLILEMIDKEPEIIIRITNVNNN